MTDFGTLRGALVAFVYSSIDVLCINSYECDIGQSGSLTSNAATNISIGHNFMTICILQVILVRLCLLLGMVVTVQTYTCIKISSDISQVLLTA